MRNIRQNLIDIKNGLPPGPLADELYPRGIVFIHVPKCAGTSTEQALRKSYRLSRIIIDPEKSFEVASKMMAVPVTDKNRHHSLQQASEIRRTALHYFLGMGYKCITGHAPLEEKTIEAFQDKYDFVTVMRDPVERYVSHLHHNYSQRGRHGRIDMAVEQFLETPRAQIMGSLYGKYYSGLPMTADFTSEEAIEKSKQNLEQMALVGFQEDLPEFARDITCLTGHKIEIGHHNKSIASMDNQYSPENLEKIRSLCAADIALYNWAKTNFR
ncbi:MAG: sulfotransferase family 2 domain-containing protein [bacterium]